MEHIDLPARGPTAGDASPRLSETVEGVEFWVVPPGGSHIRCVVTAPALCRHFGAEDDTPAGWMAAFDRHRRDLEARALATAGCRAGSTVVLVTDATGALRTAAGHCRR